MRGVLVFLIPAVLASWIAASGVPQSQIASAQYPLLNADRLIDRGEQSDSARILIAQATAAYQLGNKEGFLRAARLWAQAAELYRRAGAGSRLGDPLLHAGIAYANAGQPDSALHYLRAARGYGTAGRALYHLGRVQLSLNQADSALHYSHTAVRVLRQRLDAWGEAAALWQIAGIYHRRLSRPDLARALAYYDSAASVRSMGVRTAFRAVDDTASSAITEDEVHLFDEWALARLALTAPNNTPEDKLAALAIAERGRGHRLLSLRRSDEELLTLLRIGGNDPVADARSLLFWAIGLRPNIAGVLSYQVTQDTLLTWLVLPSGEVELSRQAIPLQLLEERVAQLRFSLGGDPGRAPSRSRRVPPLEQVSQPRRQRGFDIQASASASWLGNAHQLATTLLPPELLQRLSPSGELVIIPSGPLNGIPFSVLPVSSSGDLLGTRYALRYAPSLSVLAQTESGMSYFSSLPGRALVIGNPTMPVVQTSRGTMQALPALPGAEREGRWVGERLQVEPLTASEATLTAVKSRLVDATLIHFATHGYAYSSRERVRDSFIALAPEPGQSGLLTVGEILDDPVRLSADLVVLSACQTGRGNLQQGEGTVGLQYAFLAKGARSVLVSLWSVSDEATEQLMRTFYTHWNSRVSKAEALRRAQEEVRGEPGSRFYHPRYWAAFQLVGAG